MRSISNFPEVSHSVAVSAYYVSPEVSWRVPVKFLLLFICILIQQLPTAHAQSAGIWSSIEGLWRIEYNDTKRGVVRGEVAISEGVLKGVLFGRQAAVEKFTCDKFKFDGSRLKGSYYPYFPKTKVELTRVGKGRLIGRWKTRANIKDPGKREGDRIYDDPSDPYLFEASGKSVWTKLSPQIRRVVVAASENDALNYTKMAEHWKNAKIGNNLPKIRVDLYGEGLPLYYDARFFKLENANKNVSLHTVRGFPKEKRFEMIFYLLKGSKPGPKVMKINGQSFTVPLVFSNYREEPEGEYEISGHTIDFSEKRKQKDQRDADIRELKKRAELQQVRLNVRGAGFQSAQESLAILNSRVADIVKNLKPMLRRARDGQFIGNVDKATASMLTRRRFLQSRILAIEEEILGIEESAINFEKAGEKTKSAQKRQEGTVLQSELALQEADLKVHEAKMASFLKSTETSRASVKKQINDLRIKYSGLDRQRDAALDSVLRAHKKFDEEQLALRSLTEELADLEHARDLEGKSRALNIEGVRVADQANNKTIYFSRRTVDPAEAIPSVDDLLEESGKSVAAAKSAYLAWRSEFESNFEEARYRQRLLGGATGKIMQSAYLQAASETYFYLLDLVEDYDEGGLPLVVADLVVKTIQAVRKETLTIDNVSDEEANAIRLILEGGRKRELGLLSVQDMFNNLRTRRDNEILGATVQGPIKEAILSAARNPDKSVFQLLKSGISKELTDYKTTSRALFNPRTFTATFKAKIRPSMKLLVRSIVRDFTNQAVKNYAKSFEQAAYQEYFAADIIANECYQGFRATRERYWQARDRHQEILSARAEIVRQAKKFDKESGFQLQKSEKFFAGTKLKISILYQGTTGQFFSEDVLLNGILTEPGAENSHFLTAKFLGEKDRGKVAVKVKPRAQR